jgi:hypothetical protein
MVESVKNCQNCGYICHCGEKNYVNYGEIKKTEVCTYCRHAESDDSWKDTIKYDNIN